MQRTASANVPSEQLGRTQTYLHVRMLAKCLLSSVPGAPRISLMRTAPNWVTTVRSSPYFAKATPPPPACQELSHLSDPCSCTGVIGCSGGRITSVVLTRRGLAFNASDESSLGLLDGLQHIALYTNALTGPVPKWLLNLTSLNYVRFSANRLTGTVPTELGALTGLNCMYFDNNHLTGTMHIPTGLGALTGLNYLDLALIASRALYRRISGH
jgi:hypothetical protein